MVSFDSVPFFHSAGSHLAFSSWQLPAFGKRRSFSVHFVGYHPTIFTENPIFITSLSHKICIYQKKCVPLH